MSCKLNGRVMKMWHFFYSWKSSVTVRWRRWMDIVVCVWPVCIVREKTKNLTVEESSSSKKNSDFFVRRTEFSFTHDYFRHFFPDDKNLSPISLGVATDGNTEELAFSYFKLITNWLPKNPCKTQNLKLQVILEEVFYFI